MLAVLSAHAWMKAKVNQRIDAAIGAQIHIATIAAITAVRPAPRNKLFSPKAHAAIAAVASVDVYGDFINKTHGLCVSGKKPLL